MKKTKNFETDNKMTVDINGLRAMLSVGRKSAEDIGRNANALIKVGRRNLYSVKKIQAYIDAQTE